MLAHSKTPDPVYSPIELHGCKVARGEEGAAYVQDLANQGGRPIRAGTGDNKYTPWGDFQVGRTVTKEPGTPVGPYKQQPGNTGKEKGKGGW